MTPRRFAIFAGAALFFAATAYQSFVSIDNGEQGVVERYGRPVRDLLPGLHVKLPFGIERVRRIPGPERSLPMPVGYRLIDEKQGLSPSGAMKEWITGDRNIVEIKANVLYSVRDARKYLYGVSVVTDLDPYNREPRSPDFALRRLAEAALSEIIGRLPVTEVITSGAGDIEEAARVRLQEDAESLGLGIEIVGFQLLGADPLASVARSFRAVQDARSQRDQAYARAKTAAADTISRARRTAQRIRQEAESNGDRIVAEAESRAAQFLALHEALGPIDSAAAISYRHGRIQQLLQGAANIWQLSASEQWPAVFYTER